MFTNFKLLRAEVNVFNARHYKADALNYIASLLNKTGIKVNVVSMVKHKALEKRIIEEGADSSADLYITADAGRCGVHLNAKGMFHKVD